MGEDAVTITVNIPREQQQWLERAARQSEQTEDALVAQAIQILRRTSSYRDGGSTLDESRQ